MVCFILVLQSNLRKFLGTTFQSAVFIKWLFFLDIQQPSIAMTIRVHLIVFHRSPVVYALALLILYLYIHAIRSCHFFFAYCINSIQENLESPLNKRCGRTRRSVHWIGLVRVRSDPHHQVPSADFEPRISTSRV